LNLQRRGNSLNNRFLKRWKLGPADSTGLRSFDRQAATVIRRLGDNNANVVVDEDFFAYSASENKHGNLRPVWYIPVLGLIPTVNGNTTKQTA
jgi:hypothetical protein